LLGPDSQLAQGAFQNWISVVLLFDCTFFARCVNPQLGQQEI
jgi:hypothetical protein